MANSNEEMNDIMKIIQTLEDSNILLKGITKAIENETKKQKGGYLGMLLGSLEASLEGNTLTGKGMLRAGYRNKEGKGMLRAGFGSKDFQSKGFQLKKKINSTSSFNKLWNREVLSKWT